MLLRAAPAAATTVTAIPSASAIAASAAPDRARYRLRSRSASRAATGTRAASFATAWMASGLTRRMPATTPTMPTPRRTSARVDACCVRVAEARGTRRHRRAVQSRGLRNDAAGEVRAAVPTAPASAGCATRFGPATTPLPSPRRWRAASRPPPMPKASAARRCDTRLRCRRSVRLRSKPTNPSAVPSTAAIAPVAAPVISIVRRSCFSFAPTAAIIPSCGRRRCAMTVKLAAAMSATRKSTSVVTTSVSTAREDILRDRVTRRDDASGVARRPERVDARVARVHEHRDERGARDRRRRKQHELVAEVTRVLDRADDGALHSVEVDCRPRLEAEGVRDAVCDRRFVVRHRIPPRAEAEQRLAEGPVGLLRPVVDHLDRARQRHADDGRSRRSAPNHARAASSFAGNVCGSTSLNVNQWLASPNSARPETGAMLNAAHVRPTAAATETVSMLRISRCCRQSRRKSRHAHRDTARRAGMPPLPPELIGPTSPAATTRALLTERTGRRRGRRAGTPRGRPTTQAARRASRARRRRRACTQSARGASPPRR